MLAEVGGVRRRAHSDRYELSDGLDAFKFGLQVRDVLAACRTPKWRSTDTSMHEAFGLRNGSWWHVRGPPAWPGIVRIGRKGHRAKLTAADMSPLGGTFVIDDGRTRWEDRPKYSRQNSKADGIVATQPETKELDDLAFQSSAVSWSARPPPGRRTPQTSSKSVVRPPTPLRPRSYATASRHPDQAGAGVRRDRFAHVCGRQACGRRFPGFGR